MTDDHLSAPELPGAIARYQAAHDRRDADGAVAEFTADAKVTDDGHEYQGQEGVRRFVTKAASEYTFTRTLLRAEQPAPSDWLVVQRLVGDFPGGEVELRYRFRMAGDRIAELIIAP